MSAPKFEEVTSVMHTPSPQFYIPKFEQWMSLEEKQYRESLALDQTILIRETPRSHVENWQHFFRKVTGQ